ncbi:hypothetical protein ARSEF1564_008467 [Beauveria bassiana]
MVAVASGLWWDYSKSSDSAATLTLSLNSGNLLLSALVFLVTVAGKCTWNITAFILHFFKTRHGKEPASAIDLAHQVTLRNSGGSLNTLFEILKIHKAWSTHRPPQLLKKTCTIAIPALVMAIAFAVAPVLTSRVANKAYGTSVARLKENNCGFWRFNTTTDLGFAAALSKNVNDTSLARNYVRNFYASTSESLTARSLFVRDKLPYNVSTTADCPIPAAHRCRPGPKTAYRVATALLDSHKMLGINAKASDRVRVQINVTCSPVTPRDHVQVSEVNNASFLDFFLGEISDGSSNITYRYNIATERSGVGYMIASRHAYANSDTESKAWDPIPEFRRPDADVSIYFLSQNAVAYLAPVYDTWFSANGSNSLPLPSGKNLSRRDYLVNTMICAEQYVMCNPSTSLCTSPAGLYPLRRAVLDDNILGLNLAQGVTASRIILAFSSASTFLVVQRIGVAALWANDRVSSGNTSPGLPPNQWQVEVLGWFQTVLAGLQAQIVDFASNDNGLRPYATPQTHFSSRDRGSVTAVRDQCGNQLVQTAGEVQNFSFSGVMIIVCISTILILIDLSLESIINYATRQREWKSASKRARQADNKLHLLRMALGPVQNGHAWQRGTFDIPIIATSGEFHRPIESGNLNSYQSLQ